MWKWLRNLFNPPRQYELSCKDEDWGFFATDDELSEKLYECGVDLNSRDILCREVILNGFARFGVWKLEEVG